jgi:putative transposase
MKRDLDTASDGEWELASERAVVLAALAERPHNVEDVDRAAKRLRLSRAMVYRLLSKFSRDPTPSALLPNRRGRKTGRHILDSEIEQLLAGMIKSFYLVAERPKVTQLYRVVQVECRRLRRSPPSYKTIASRIREIDPMRIVRSREGAKVARSRYRVVGTGLRPRLPLELVQVDHTLADVIVVDELERQPIGRPWLTVVIDVATRVVMGFHLSLDSPSSTSVALAVSHAVLRKHAYLHSLDVHEAWPVHGIPTMIHLDNAKEFHSQALARGSREHGIELSYRPPGLPHFGGHIERLIGTLMGEVHLLPGTTFSSVAARGVYDSAKKAVMTFKELEQWLTLQICGVYHNSRHSALGRAPLEAWKTGLDRLEAGIPEPVDPRRFYLDFLPGERRQIRRDGIQLFRIHYWDNALSPLAGRTKQEFLIRYDPRDLSQVFVKDEAGDDYMAIPYRDLSRPAISLSEHRSVMQQLAKNRSMTATEDNVFSAVLAQRAVIEHSRKKTASARRKRETLSARQVVPPEKKVNHRTESGNDKPFTSVQPYKVEVWE